MTTSQEFFDQLQGMGEMPNYQQEIARAYDAPVLRPLVGEAANLESQYLPALFQPFENMGTGAADMSPAAKLSAIGGSMSRLGSRINANNAIQNFYGAQINDLAGKMGQQYNDKRSYLTNLYNMAFQREQAEAEAARAAEAQAAAARQQQAIQEALRSAYGGSVGGVATSSPSGVVRKTQYDAFQDPYNVAGGIARTVTGIGQGIASPLGIGNLDVFGMDAANQAARNASTNRMAVQIKGANRLDQFLQTNPQYRGRIMSIGDLAKMMNTPGFTYNPF